MNRFFLTALLIFASATALTACKGNCRQLSEKLCQCSRNSEERDACLRRASQEESRMSNIGELDQGDEDVCKGLLESCDCNLIDTPAGKKACGLSR